MKKHLIIRGLLEKEDMNSCKGVVLGRWLENNKVKDFFFV
jgi:hypothetical protein